MHKSTVSISSLPPLKVKSQSLHKPFIGEDTSQNITKISLNTSRDHVKTVASPPKKKNMHPCNTSIMTKRTRSYNVKLSTKVHIFYGLSYVQYDAFLRNDFQIQQVIIRDILRMVLDKASTLKNMLNNSNRMRKIVESLKNSRRSDLNTRLEVITGLIHYIAKIILLDFVENYHEIGIKRSPLENPSKLLLPIKSELRAFDLDVEIFAQVVEFLRDCMDCFLILLRQARKRIFDDETSLNLIRAISETRFSIGKLYEEFLMYEKIVEEKEKGQIEAIMEMIKKKKREEREKSEKSRPFKISEQEKESELTHSEMINSPNLNPTNLNGANNSNEKRNSLDKNVQPSKSHFVTNNNMNTWESVGSVEGDFLAPNLNMMSGVTPSKSHKKLIERELSEENEAKIKERIERMEKLKVLTTLLQNKFKFQSSKFVTRESKIPLNSQFNIISKEDIQKQVLLDADRIKNEKTVADNRRKVMLERISNPLSFLGVLN